MPSAKKQARLDAGAARRPAKPVTLPSGFRARPDELARYENVIRDRAPPTTPRAVETTSIAPPPAGLLQVEHIRDWRRAHAAEKSVPEAEPQRKETKKQRRARERAERVEQRAARAAEVVEERRLRELELAGVPIAQGTAHTARAITTKKVVDQGKYETRAYVGSIENALRSAEITAPRLLAWDEFAKIRFLANQANVKSPSLDRVSGGRGGRPETLAAVLRDAEIRKTLDEVSYDVMVLVIEDGLTYRTIAGPLGNPRLVSVVFKDALDRTAYALGLGPEPDVDKRKRRDSQARAILRQAVTLAKDVRRAEEARTEA